MHARVLVIILGVMLCAVGARSQVPGADRIVGSWDADFVAMLREEPMSAEERSRMESMLRGARMTIVFGPDGALQMTGEMMGEEKRESGRWMATEGDQSTLVIVTTTRSADGTESSDTIYVRFLSADAAVMSDGPGASGDRVPFTRAQGTTGAQLPAGVVLALAQGGDPTLCPVAALARSPFVAVDLNADGALDYVVELACEGGANDATTQVMLAVPGGYAPALSHYGEALEVETTTTNGFRELRGTYCDGLADCQVSFYRWDGTAYEVYRQVTDVRVAD